MKKSFKQFQLYILLMFFWMILNGAVDIETILYGSVFSIAIMFMTYEIIFELDRDILRLPQLWRFLWFAIIILIEIIKSANQHIIRIIKNENKYEVFEVVLDTNNMVIITLIANAITLTPGTITLDVKGRTLEVIGFAKTDKDVDEMKKTILSYQKPFLYRRK